MFASRYVSLDQPFERGWKPLYIVVLVCALVCALSIVTFSSRNHRMKTVLIGELDPLAYNPKDLQESSQDLKYASPKDVDDIYNNLDDEVGAMEQEVAALKKKWKGPEVIDITVNKIGPPGPQGPPGIRGTEWSTTHQIL